MPFQVLHGPVQGNPFDGLVFVCLVRRLDGNTYRRLFGIPHIHFDWWLVALLPLPNSMAARPLFFQITKVKWHCLSCLMEELVIWEWGVCLFYCRECYCFQTHGGCPWLAAVRLCNDVEACGAVPHLSMRGSMLWFSGVTGVRQRYRYQLTRIWCNGYIWLFKYKLKSIQLMHNWI